MHSLPIQLKSTHANTVILRVLQDTNAEREGDLYIRSVSFSPDGRHLATGAEDKQIRVSKKKRKMLRTVMQTPVCNVDLGNCEEENCLCITRPWTGHLLVGIQSRWFVPSVWFRWSNCTDMELGGEEMYTCPANSGTWSERSWCHKRCRVTWWSSCSRWKFGQGGACMGRINRTVTWEVGRTQGQRLLCRIYAGRKDADQRQFGQDIENVAARYERIR